MMEKKKYIFPSLFFVLFRGENLKKKKEWTIKNKFEKSTITKYIYIYHGLVAAALAALAAAARAASAAIDAALLGV